MNIEVCAVASVVKDKDISIRQGFAERETKRPAAHFDNLALIHLFKPETSQNYPTIQKYTKPPRFYEQTETAC